jgi:hypothetical protein
MADVDGLILVEEPAYGRIFPTEWSTDDALEVAGDIRNNEFIFFCCLYLETIFLIDGIDAEVVVPMPVCGKEMARL